MTVYTETVVYLAPAAYQADVPYQVAIIALDDDASDDGARVTGRIEGDRVRIGDTVEKAGERDGVPYFRKV